MSGSSSGAPDNVTIVIGDVVDLTGSSGPSTTPQIVGAAAVHTKGTRPIPVTPAAKAAALSRAASGDEDADEVPLAEEGAASGRLRWLRRGLVALLVLVVGGGGAYAAYDWSQRQYFVGAHDGQVTIFRGVSQNLGPISLSSVESESDVAIDNLPDFYRAKVDDTVSTDTLAAAQDLVDQLRIEAGKCAVRKAQGGTCATGGATVPTPTTTTSSTTTSTTAARPTTTTSTP
jgi:protein phosphatase